jgi:RHS repeat-associated protein
MKKNFTSCLPGRLLLTMGLVFCFLAVHAQDTLYISPVKDAVLNYRNPNGNYGNNQYITAEVNPDSVYISLIEFALDSVPEGAYVTSAKLMLYGVSHLSSGNSNKSYLRRLTSSWTESTVTWNTKPTFTTADQVTLNESTSTDQNYELDVTIHVRDMLLNGGNYGFGLQLINALPTAYMRFGSSDHSNSAKHPKVEIVYEMPDPLVLKPTSFGVNCLSTSVGAINLEVVGGIAPYTYAWSDGGMGSWTTEDISALTAGNYSITVTDALNVESNTTVGVASAVELLPNDFVSTTYFNNDVSTDPCVGLQSQATKAGTDNWTNGVLSENLLAASTDGWVEFTVDGDDSKRMFGLTEVSSSDGNWTSMLFGFYMNGVGDLIAIENGSQVSPVLGAYQEGDVLRISRASTGITLQKNGATVHTVSHEEIYFDYTDELAVDVNIYDVGGTMNGLRASFDNPIRVTSSVTPVSGVGSNGTITVMEDCYSGYSYALSDGTNSYTPTTISGGVEFTSLPDGDYTLTVSRSGITRSTPFTFVLRNDDDINWELSEVYDLGGTMVKAAKTYFDKAGRTVQQQKKNLTSANVIATQQVYDEFGRPVVTTLPAPLFTNEFNFRPQFISDANGAAYDYTKFDLPVTGANAYGEVNNPKKVDQATKGTVGWYYSDNNTEEPYVATTFFPYSRVEYDEIRPGATKRSSAPHNQLRMGKGHEPASYTLLSAGELKYVYGFANGWAGGDFETVSESGCDLLLSNDFLEKFEVFKTVSFDAEGKEMVSFKTKEGWLIATAYSGTADDGLNAETYDVQKVIRPHDDWRERYVDIHLPEGCENTVQIEMPAGFTYDVLDLKTNAFVYQNATDDTPALAAGLYRILNTTAPEFDGNMLVQRNIYVKYNLNYYDYTLYYHDKAGRVIATVPPLGVDLYVPKWSYYESQDSEAFALTTTSGISSWGVGTVGTEHMSITVPATSSGDPNQYNLLTMYLDKGTTISSDLSIESTSRSSETLVTDTAAKALAAQAVNYAYETSASFSSPESCSCDTNSVCITATSFTAAMDATKGYCQGQYVHLTDMGSNSYCFSCQDSAMQDVKTYEVELQLVQTTGEGDVIVGSQQMIVSEFEDGWQFGAVAGTQTATNIPGAMTFSFRLRDGDTAPSLKLVVASVTATEPDLDEGNWDGFSRKTTQDLTGFENISLKYGFLTYYLNEDPKHGLYSLFDYNSKNELLSDDTPDEGKTEYLYSADGYLRFSQNAYQATKDYYTYYRYDDAGRLIENGEYQPSGDDYYFQNYYLEPTLPYGQSVNTASILDDLNATFGTASYHNDPTYVFYDLKDPDFGTETSLNTITYCQRFLRGRVSKTWAANNGDAGTSPRIITWYSYLPDGEIEWMVQKINDVNGGSKVITTHYTYDDAKNVATTVFQKDVPAEYFEHRYSYDADNRLAKVETRTSSGGSWQEEAEYDYYLHGPLKRIELANDLQGIDYLYTTTGWLKAINSPNLGYSGCDMFADPGGDGQGSSTFATDVFGMSLDYFNYDYERKHSNVNFGAYYAEGGVNADMNNWDGKIKSTRWRLQNETVDPSQDESWMAVYDDHWMYTYSYNKKDWLKEASFGTYLAACQNDRNPYCFPEHHAFQFLANTDEDYRVWNMDYDANGNIKHLNRKAYEVSGTNRMDELTYNYASCSNQLDYIGDTYIGSNWATDLDNQAAGNYTYNEIGQLISDHANDIRMEYDAYGKVIAVTKKTNTSYKYLTITYDDKGQRLSKTNYTNGTTIAETYWYMNGPDGNNQAIYKVASGTLSKIEQPLYGGNQLGIYYPQASDYIYSISDHLGSVRATVERNKVSGAAVVSTKASYYPYGSEMPNKTTVASPEYRHGYQGEYTEKDVETGFDNFELRMWDARMARWMAPDPYRQYHSPYLGMGNDPINGLDPDGGFTRVGAWFYKLRHGGEVVKHASGKFWQVNSTFTSTINGVSVTGTVAVVGKVPQIGNGVLGVSGALRNITRLIPYVVRFQSKYKKVKKSTYDKAKQTFNKMKEILYEWERENGADGNSKHEWYTDEGGPGGKPANDYTIDVDWSAKDYDEFQHGDSATNDYYSRGGKKMESTLVIDTNRAEGFRFSDSRGSGNFPEIKTRSLPANR